MKRATDSEIKAATILARVGSIRELAEALRDNRESRDLKATVRNIEHECDAIERAVK